MAWPQVLGAGRRGRGLRARTHRVAAVLVDHHAASEGLIVRFDMKGPLFPVQDVFLHENHVLHTSDLQGKGQWGCAGDKGLGAQTPRASPGKPQTPGPHACRATLLGRGL